MARSVGTLSRFNRRNCAVCNLDLFIGRGLLPPLRFLLPHLRDNRVVSSSLRSQERRLRRLWHGQLHDHWTLLSNGCSSSRSLRFGLETLETAKARPSAPWFPTACLATSYVSYLLLRRSNE